MTELTCDVDKSALHTDTLLQQRNQDSLFQAADGPLPWARQERGRGLSDLTYPPSLRGQLLRRTTPGAYPRLQTQGDVLKVLIPRRLWASELAELN